MISKNVHKDHWGIKTTVNVAIFAQLAGFYFNFFMYHEQISLSAQQK